ncbi:MAG: Transcriptional regulatory protein QseF [Deltaproteobacteria bacterium ADurb.Bin510]|nr:MAG: Transcriptional regulatory protein QseF [Deltaproteobacteria bacterium ADurb.Bin510]
MDEPKARILLVDDEEMLLEIGSEMIEFLGYSVKTAQGGQECLDILENDQNFDLVILDMAMPDLDGQQTLAEIQKRSLAKRVIISSGFNLDSDRDAILASERVVGALNKPFNLSELSRIINETLQ